MRNTAAAGALELYAVVVELLGTERVDRSWVSAAYHADLPPAERDGRREARAPCARGPARTRAARERAPRLRARRCLSGARERLAPGLCLCTCSAAFPWSSLCTC